MGCGASTQKQEQQPAAQPSPQPSPQPSNRPLAYQPSVRGCVCSHAGHLLSATPAALDLARTLEKTFGYHMCLTSTTGLRTVQDSAPPKDVPIPSGPQAPPFVTKESYNIYKKYLTGMPNCVASMEITRGDSGGKIGTNVPLNNIIPFCMHHIDGKTFGGQCVLREWGGTTMYSVYIGYNPVVVPGYFSDLGDIPVNLMQAAMVQSQGGSIYAEGTYSVAPQTRLTLSLPDTINQNMAKSPVTGQPMKFLEANRCLAGFLILRAFADAANSGKQVMIWEDGGYMNPIFDAAIESKISIADFRTNNGIPPEPSTDILLPPYVYNLYPKFLLGSVELTRNGYDATRALFEQRQAASGTGHVNIPFFSGAASYEKVMLEGDNITLACLDGLDQVLYGIGWSLSKRNVAVLGSRGNLGRRFCKHLSDVLQNPTGTTKQPIEGQVFGMDMKVNWNPPQPADTPPWQTPWNTPVPNIIGEYVNYKAVPSNLRQQVDVVFGWTGGPTNDVVVPSIRYGTFAGSDLQDFLNTGQKYELFLASGSTKTAEFEDALAWLNSIINAPTSKVVSKNPTKVQVQVGSFPWNVEVAPIPDSLTYSSAIAAGLSQQDIDKIMAVRNFGTQFCFTNDTPVVKVLYLVNNTMPVNFMFYGTPTEIMDLTYAQVTSIAALLANEQIHGTLGVGMFPTDYVLSGTLTVYEATNLTQDYNCPRSSGIPAAADPNA